MDFSCFVIAGEKWRQFPASGLLEKEGHDPLHLVHRFKLITSGNFIVMIRTTIRGFRTSLGVQLAMAAVTRTTVQDVNNMYLAKKPVSMVTAHDFITAKYAETADIDINLIGDSLAMVALGYQDTNEIEFEEFMYHTKAVQRGNQKSLLIADLPFGSYELSPEMALETSMKLIKYAKIQGVKIEGGQDIVPTISKITGTGIPVMGHVGLTPQKHNALGGFKLQGNTVDTAVKIYQDCLSLEKAGVFSIVLECIPNRLAQLITEKLSIPTIGIGAGPSCSGHVLVMADLLGMNGPAKSKFVKQYVNMFELGVEGLKKYKLEIIGGEYPNEEEHGYKMKREVLKEVKERIDDME